MTGEQQQQVPRRRRLRGQALVFSLLFLAVGMVTLLMLYNQGLLIQNRVQVENAADAAAYSQAKLAARNQNFAAYTNRAMVANEVSIGQLVAVASWAKRYANIPRWVDSYPLYQVPIAPPAPQPTFAQALKVVYLPYIVLGNVAKVPANALVGPWPTVVSYFNGTLGVFQKLFAASTIMAQIESYDQLVEAHNHPNDVGTGDKEELYIPFLGYYFLVQNSVLTYFGDSFSIDNLVSGLQSASGSSGGSYDPYAAAGEFAKSTVGSPETMIRDNNPAKVKKKSGAGGSTSNNTDDVKAAYQRYAAIVNDNRDGWTEDRHFQLGLDVGESFSFSIPIGIGRIDITLGFNFFAGSKSDGGTVYRYNNLAVGKGEEIESYGWSSIDVTSIGVQFDIMLAVDLEICLPIVGCNTIQVLDIALQLPFGFPVSGATQQVVADIKDVKKFMPQWGFPGMHLLGVPGGDMYAEAFDLFHLQTLAWGNIVPPTGMYGTSPEDYKTTYAGPPSFFSLGDGFKEAGESYEFTVAVAKQMEGINTSDNPDGFNITGNPAMPEYTQMGLDSRSYAEDSGYQQVIWEDQTPLMTISSAETYFANPFEDEAANLFSPFWDARLRESSTVAQLIATGEIPWEQLIDGLSAGSATKTVISFVLDKIGDEIVESGVGYLVGNIQPPMDSVVEPIVTDAAEQVVDTTKNAVLNQLDTYIPD